MWMQQVIGVVEQVQRVLFLHPLDDCHRRLLGCRRRYTLKEEYVAYHSVDNQ